MSNHPQSDSDIFDGLRLRALRILYGKYNMLYSVLCRYSNNDLIDLYYDYAADVDFSTLETSKAGINRHISLLKNGISSPSGKASAFIGGLMSRVGLASLPESDYCDTYLNDQTDQEKLYAVFTDFKTEVKRMEAEQL